MLTRRVPGSKVDVKHVETLGQIHNICISILKTTQSEVTLNIKYTFR